MYAELHGSRSAGRKFNVDVRPISQEKHLSYFISIVVLEQNW